MSSAPARGHTSSTSRRANINDGCGATAPEALQKAVVEKKADIGFAFDGDGDRVMSVDARGRLHDGDTILGVVARHFARAGRLTPPVIVGTVMTNGALEALLKTHGVELVARRSATATSGRRWEKQDAMSAASRPDTSLPEGGNDRRRDPLRARAPHTSTRGKRR